MDAFNNLVNRQGYALPLEPDDAAKVIFDLLAGRTTPDVLPEHLARDPRLDYDDELSLLVIDATKLLPESVEAAADLVFSAVDRK